MKLTRWKIQQWVQILVVNWSTSAGKDTNSVPDNHIRDTETNHFRDLRTSVGGVHPIREMYIGHFSPLLITRGALLFIPDTQATCCSVLKARAISGLAG